MNIQNRGVILVTAIFLVLLIATLGIGYLSLVNNQLEMADVALKSAEAFYCAESGISEAILYLKGIDWVGLEGVLVSADSYEVEVDTETLPAENIITIKSTGKMSNFQRIIEVTLDKTIVPGKIIQQNWKEV